MKSTLKAPGTKRLKLEYDEMPSISAFEFNLRCHTMASVILCRRVTLEDQDKFVKVGRCRLTQ